MLPDITPKIDQADAAPRPDAPDVEVPSAPPTPRLTPTQMVWVGAGVVAFLYFARPVALPIVLACVAGMTLNPLVRWLSYCHIPPVLGAALVLVILVAGVGIGFVQLGRPAVAWVNEAPEHMEKLRQRVQGIFKHAAWVNQTAAAVSALGTTDEEQKKPVGVAIKETSVPATFLNWTSTLLAMVGETLVLLYLLLASGDLFLQKLVHVMPTMSDKKRAVEISRELEQSISNYLFSVALVNIALGLVVKRGPLAVRRAQRGHVGTARGGAELRSLLRPSRGHRPVGHRRTHQLRDAVEGTPAARLVSAPPSICWKRTSSRLSCWDAASRSTRGHLCLPDLLDVVVGRAGSVALRAYPRVGESRVRPRACALLSQRTLGELSRTMPKDHSRQKARPSCRQRKRFRTSDWLLPKHMRSCQHRCLFMSTEASCFGYQAIVAVYVTARIWPRFQLNLSAQRLKEIRKSVDAEIDTREISVDYQYRLRFFPETGCLRLPIWMVSLLIAPIPIV